MWASARRPRRNRSTRSAASRSSFLTRRFPQLLPNGWARCTLAPARPTRPLPNTSRRSPRGRPRGAHRPGRSPRPDPIGSLSILTVSIGSPDAVLRTITLRRRCRSMPTYSDSTGVLLRLVVLEDPSFRSLLPWTKRGPLRHRCLCQRLPPRPAPGPVTPARSRESGFALLHPIKYVTTSLVFCRVEVASCRALFSCQGAWRGFR